jgi:hypothetical protein
LTTATQTEALQDRLSDQEVNAMLEDIRTVLYSSDTLCSEWVVSDVSAYGIAERLVSMAYPLFENEGEEDNPATNEFLLYANPQVSYEAFIEALLVAGLPRMVAIMTDIESHIAAEDHVRGITDLGQPLRRWDVDRAKGLGSLTEEAARASYLETLERVTGHEHFEEALRDALLFATMPSEIGRNETAWRFSH